MSHKKGHKDKIKKPTAPNISSGPDTTFTASSSDQVIAQRKLSSKVRIYGSNPNEIKYTRNSKTGKYTASTTVKKLNKGGHLNQYD
tara:strand:- start:811 stop:1068 length:258 start_codon:yes stop_codon:yes gene_type:complete